MIHRTASRNAILSRRRAALPLIVGLALLTAGCEPARHDGPVAVDVIGTPAQFAKPLKDSRSPAAKLVLAATGQGLLSFDTGGEVVGALAESWIVEDGGQSYIFRLRRTHWANGEPVKAEAVADLLKARLRANAPSLGGLAPQVRAMTERVIEIRLDTALPAFMQLLAQPQFAIVAADGVGSGPYRAVAEDDGIALTPLIATPGDEDTATPPPAPAIDRRQLRASSAALALVRFRRGLTDLVLGGRFQHLPLLSVSDVDPRTLRVDPAWGLFGLAVTGSSDFLADVNVREALSRVIDRDALGKSFHLTGWRSAVTPVPAALDLGRAPTQPVWAEGDGENRIAIARQSVARWVAAHGEPPVLRVALPEGPGATLLFRRLAADFSRLGVRIDRVAMDERADLTLIDEVAAFDSALWYLARIDCPMKISCDTPASALLETARTAVTAEARANAMAEAERRIVLHGGYIPLGQPVRWALASRRLTGFALSARGIHPLNRLIALPN